VKKQGLIAGFALAAAGVGVIVCGEIDNVKYINEARGGHKTTGPVKTFVTSFVTTAALIATFS
jgi:hypothetical protein